MIAPEELISVREAAILSQRSEESVRRWVWSGKLFAQKIGNQLFLRRSDVARVVRQRSRGRDISLNDLDQLYEVRRLIEDFACKSLISNISQPDIQQLEALLHEARMLFTRKDLVELRRVNRRFHAILYHATGNRYLEEVLLNLREKSWRYIEPAIRIKRRAAQAVAGHGDIVDALKRNDLDGLRKAIADDLAATVARVQSTQRALRARDGGG